MRECAHIAIRASKRTHTHTCTHARKKLAEELAGTELLAGHFVQLCFELHCETGQEAGWKAFR